MRVENTVDVVESAERETAPVVEPADDARSVPHRERARKATHPGEDGSDIADDCIRARCFGGNSKPARHHLCPLDRRHPCTHVRGIGTVRRDERQLTFGIGFRSVVVGPVTRFCGRGGT
jgi:hypothetical protein